MTFNYDLRKSKRFHWRGAAADGAQEGLRVLSRERTREVHTVLGQLRVAQAARKGVDHLYPHLRRTAVAQGRDAVRS